MCVSLIIIINSNQHHYYYYYIFIATHAGFQSQYDLSIFTRQELISLRIRLILLKKSTKFQPFFCPSPCITLFVQVVGVPSSGYPQCYPMGRASPSQSLPRNIHVWLKTVRSRKFGQVSSSERTLKCALSDCLILHICIWATRS